MTTSVLDPSGPTVGRMLPWIVFALALGVLVASAASRDPWRTDEHRYIEIGRQMTEAGHWLVPELNGTTYFDKPPVFFWLVAASHLAGVPLGFAGLLPSLIGAGLTLALVFAWGRHSFDLATAWTATAILASIQLFASLGLRANLDSLLTACVTAACYGLLRGIEAGRSPGSRQVVWMAGAGLATGFGVLVKGPVALVVPGSALAALLLVRRHRLDVSLRSWSILGSALLLPPLLWLGAAALEAGSAYVVELVWGHAVGHALGHVSKVRPWWFYAKDFPGSLLPWSVFLPALGIWLRSTTKRPGLVFVLLCSFVPLIVMSLFPAKRHLYLLPLCPAMALLIASLCHAPRPASLAFQLSWDVARCLLGIVGGLLGLGLIAGSGLAWGGADRVLTAAWSYWEACGPRIAAGAIPFFAFTAGGLLLLGAALVIDRKTVAQEIQGIRALGLGVALFLIGVVHPVEALGRSTVGFYASVEPVVGDEPLGFYGSSDFAPNWMLGRDDVSMLPDRESAASFAARGPARKWLVAEASSLTRLGTPDGARVVLSSPRPFDSPMVLLEWSDGSSLAGAARPTR